ncbi:hypothetical protein [Microbacterium sp. CFBP9034]|uniref:hypothetical protein n=1 Tax=Microbacterium sp. CFBP9034 TaxID=3096540 RepID=UPI002A6A041F|nr:hypothetical protein [Microbacterium sp. CFBP9034]MDY0910391.1 hypothetical protein [Microbacterium sp. CFBP9034]
MAWTAALTRRRVRALSWTLAGAFTATVALAVLGYPLYVAPPVDEVTDADLIYVIGPPKPERIAVERALREGGVADLSLYSVGLLGIYTADTLEVCDEPDVFCVHPRPFTTKGEIAYLEGFAEDHDVERTIVLTFTPHVLRTRYILDKCYDGDATVMAVEQELNLGDWIYQYAYQSTALVKAWATPCAELRTD